jgi:hypothetical protein
MIHSPGRRGEAEATAETTPEIGDPDAVAVDTVF